MRWEEQDNKGKNNKSMQLIQLWRTQYTRSGRLEYTIINLVKNRQLVLMKTRSNVVTPSKDTPVVLTMYHQCYHSSHVGQQCQWVLMLSSSSSCLFYLPSQHILQTIRAEHTFKSISWSFQISTSITINEPSGLGRGHLIFSNVIEFQEMWQISGVSFGHGPCCINTEHHPRPPKSWRFSTKSYLWACSLRLSVWPPVIHITSFTWSGRRLALV